MKITGRMALIRAEDGRIDRIWDLAPGVEIDFTLPMTETPDENRLVSLGIDDELVDLTPHLERADMVLLQRNANELRMIRRDGKVFFKQLDPDDPSIEIPSQVEARLQLRRAQAALPEQAVIARKVGRS